MIYRDTKSYDLVSHSLDRDHRLGPDLFHNLQLIFLAANVMHPSSNGLSPLLGIYRSKYQSTEILAQFVAASLFLHLLCIASLCISQLGWPSLSDRRLNNRLKIFGKTVAGRVAI